jgi:ABC-type transport system involved in multi-copper enzyme maturation permease subunit
MHNIDVLVKHELFNKKKIFSVLAIAAGFIYILDLFFNSKTLQLVVFQFGNIPSYQSYYHAVALPIFFIAIPLICMIASYDSISKDIREKKIRLIATKVSRQDYLLSKAISNMIVAMFVSVSAILFIMFRTVTIFKNAFPSTTANMLISILLVSFFLISVFTMISSISNSPLLVSFIVIFASFIVLNITSASWMSFFSYITLVAMPLNSALMLLFGTILIFMTNIYYFNRRRL